MKIGFIFILFRTPESEVSRLKKEVKNLGLKDYKTYLIDNTDNGQGYAAGVNNGLRKAIADGCEIFAVANPDIKLGQLARRSLGEGGLGSFDQLVKSLAYDIMGFAMRQQGKTYYGGQIDRWRMSGGLIDKKPVKRFVETDFVSGSLMIIKKSVIDKIGFFDESYFMYYEEVDYCYRAKKAGFKVGIDSKLSYEHFESSQDNPKKAYFLFRNRLKFLNKYGSLTQKLREFIRLPKTVFEEVRQRPFYLNFFSLNISSIVNKAFHFIFFLILINAFRPADYGIYTLAWTQASLLSSLPDFGTTNYGLVHINDGVDKKVRELFPLRFYLSLLTFVLTIVLAVVFRYPTSIFIPIVLVSFVIFANMFSGTYLILTSIKQKSYLASIVSMVFQIFLIISLIAGVLITHQMLTVFIITFAMYNLYSLINFILVKKEVGKLSLKINLNQWHLIIKKSFVYLIISLLASFYSKADVLVLNFIKGKQAVGLYSAGYKFLDASMFVVSSYNVSSMPLFSQLAKDKKKSLFVNKIKKDVVLVSAIGLAIALGFYFLGPIVLPVFFKSTYSQSIKVLKIIIFALPLILLTSVFLNSIYALNKAKAVIFLFLFQMVFNYSMNFLFVPKFGFFASAYITVAGETLNTLICLIILNKFIHESFR